MADHTLAPGDSPANPAPASATDGGHTQPTEGNEPMNMMTPSQDFSTEDSKTVGDFLAPERVIAWIRCQGIEGPLTDKFVADKGWTLFSEAIAEAIRETGLFTFDKAGGQQALDAILALDGQSPADIPLDAPARRLITRAVELVNERLDSSDLSKWKPFLDEFGRPSDRAGPDLTKATPIEAVLADLAHRKTGSSGTYSTAFLRAAKQSGIDLAVNHDDDGEHLLMWLPCDTQEELRRPRYDALRAHVSAKPRRRQSVIDLLNMLGRFSDNRKFASIEEAAAEYLAAGGRIYVLPDGRCEETIPAADNVLEDSWNGYPLRRLKYRYEATLHAKGAREQMADFVRAKGTLSEGGSYVLERKG